MINSLLWIWIIVLINLSLIGGQFQAFEPQNKTILAKPLDEKIDYHKELHKILVRTIINKIDESALLNSDGIRFIFNVTQDQFQTLKNYVNSKSTVFPETVNKLFENSLDVETSTTPYEIGDSFDEEIISNCLYYSGICFGVLLSTYCLYKRPVSTVVIFVIVLIVVQKGSSRYQEIMNERIALSQKYPDLPYACRAEKSYYFYEKILYSQKREERACKEYFNRIGKHPFFDISIPGLFYDIISEIFTHFAETFGKSIGIFYGNASDYANIFCISLLLIVFAIAFGILWRFLSPSTIQKVKKKRQPRKTIENGEKPCLEYE